MKWKDMTSYSKDANQLITEEKF